MSGYLVAMLAIGRSVAAQRNAARWNGSMLILLGLGILVEVVRRFFLGSEPVGLYIVGPANPLQPA